MPATAPACSRLHQRDRGRLSGRRFRPSKHPDSASNRGVSGRRYYSPTQGRFLGRDPKQELGGLNLYGFCRNNPINLWDILGMSPPATIQTGVVGGPQQTMYWRNGTYGPGYYSTSEPEVTSEGDNDDAESDFLGSDDNLSLATDDAQGKNNAPNNAGGNTTGTFGIRLNLTATYGVGPSVVLAFQSDRQGGIELQLSIQKTTALPGASATVGYTVTNAPSVQSLTGWGGSVGTAGGALLGGEVNFVAGNGYTGFDVGGGVSTPGISPQVNYGYTWTLLDLSKNVNPPPPPMPDLPPLGP
jgi:RHS repeat-associated protein